MSCRWEETAAGDSVRIFNAGDVAGQLARPAIEPRRSLRTMSMTLSCGVSEGSMAPPRRRARTTAPTAAISSRNDAASNGKRNFVSSSSPIWPGPPKPGSYCAPFTLGTLTYELVTGRNPFAAATASGTIVNVIRGSVPPPSEANPAVPKDLDGVIARALTRDLSERQQSAAALSAELRSVAAVLDVRSGDVHEPSALIPIDETPDRQAAGLLTGALIAAGAAAAIVWWLLTRT